MNDIDENLEAYEKAGQIAQLDFSHLGTDDFDEVEYDDDGNPYGIVQGVPVAINTQPQGDGVQPGAQLEPHVFRQVEEAAAPESGYSELHSDMARGLLIGQRRAGEAFTETAATGLGAPVDILNEGLRYLGLGSDYPIGGSDSIRDGLNAIVSFGSSLIPDDIVAAGESFAAETPQSPLIQTIVDEVTRFGLQAVGPAMYLRAFTVMTPFARGLAWGGIADFINAEPDEESAIAALTKYVSGATEEERGAFANAVLLVVERNENDPKLINKARHALDGMIIGGVLEKGLEGIILAVRVIRSGALRKTMVNAGARADARLRSMASGTTLSANPIGAAGDLALSAAGKLARKDEPAPVFFSAVRNAVDALPMEKGGASQMRAMIAKGEGVKAEEMAWTGLDDFLKGKKSVTKAEIKEYMDANQVRIEEVVKGTAPDKVQIRQAFQLQNQTGTELANAAYRSGMSKREVHRLSIQLERGEVLASELPEELQPLAFKYIGAFEDYTALKAGQATKFSEYTLPGGENYREVLLTLPDAKATAGNARMTAIDGEIAEITQRYPVMDTRPADASFRIGALRDEYYREAEGLREGPSFTSGHYDEPNVLAHIRLNDRTGPNGERILFIEEIQSDWHQKGRKGGYINPANVGKTEVFETTTMRVRAAFDTDEEARAFIREQADREGLDYAPHGQGILAGDLVPDAPLKKTWHETSLRRVIRMAAEEGYDTVAWTPGRMQADRYDLSKQVEEISYHASGNETSVILKGVKGISDQDLELVLDGEGIIKVTDFGAPDDWKGKHIEDVVGKDIAEKIMSGSGDYRRYQELNRKDIAGKLNNPEEIEEFSALAKRKLATSRKGSISGEGLQVGGEGMKAFYDKMLKKYASKFGKKFGAKVGTVEIIGGGNKPISFEEFIFVYPSDGPFELIDIANNPGLDRRMNEEYSKFLEGRKSDQVWNIPITKKMRESVLKKGVPLFSAAGAAAVATQDKKQPAI
jgi:DNA-binding ferritin-like protein (Dps family)